MSEILYYDYPTVVEASSEVLCCTERGGRYAAVLSRTMIFPEGGGQLPDGGKIFNKAGKTAEIIDCQTEGGEIVHLLSAPFDAGETVTVQLDLEKRLDRSEQHTGEHILSGLAAKLFSAHNVGFHMAEDYCTIDLDIPLDAEQLQVLEEAANAAVRADLPVHTEVTDGDEASRRKLRKRAEKAQGEVRIVYIDNGKVDSCTCCGTHLHTTGMVGAIRITDSQSYKGGTRLTFSCGARAARLGMEEHAALSALARQYSTSRSELPAAIKKQMEELASLKSELRQKSLMLGERIANELIASAETVENRLLIVKRLDGMGANDLKSILDNLSGTAQKNGTGFMALLFASGEGSTDYRMTCSNAFKLNMKEVCRAVNAATGGKGGGSPVFAQGKTDRKLDDETIAALKNYLISAIKN